MDVWPDRHMNSCHIPHIPYRQTSRSLLHHFCLQILQVLQEADGLDIRHRSVRNGYMLMFQALKQHLP